jgi:hypothetical protein
MAFCRRLFEEFRSDFLWRYDVISGQDISEQNDMDFNQYCDATRKLIRIPLEQRLRFENTPPDDPRIAAVTHEEFFRSEFWRYHPEAAFTLSFRTVLEVAKPTALVILDLRELLDSGYIDPELLPRFYEHYLALMLRRIALDYQIFGFSTADDPNIVARLRNRVECLSEDQLIERVLLPLLKKMGFERLRMVSVHGPGEFGSDILPFRTRTPFGTFEYYALQAKAVAIHGTSSRDGNAGELISQAAQALAVSFVDDVDNERKHLDKFVIASSRAITGTARQVIEAGIEGRRKLVFIDGDALIDLVRQYGLVQYLLFTDFES